MQEIWSDVSYYLDTLMIYPFLLSTLFMILQAQKLPRVMTQISGSLCVPIVVWMRVALKKLKASKWRIMVVNISVMSHNQFGI